jgi:hypothetical protein
MKGRIFFFGLTIFFVTIQACKESAVPSYIYIPSIQFDVTPDQGTAAKILQKYGCIKMSSR